MLRTLHLVIAGLLVLLGAAQGHAQIITIDPDSFADGTSLTNAFAGVTITQGDGSTGITSQLGLTGSQQFSINGTTGNFSGLSFPPSSTLAATLSASISAGNILRFDFSTPIDFASIDLIPNDSFDPGSIAAFDSLGNFIDSDSFGGVNLSGIRTTLSVSGLGITTLLVGGDNTGNNLEIDTLQYTAVPEPSSLALFGLAAGVAGGYVVRRRRRKAQDAITA